MAGEAREVGEFTRRKRDGNRPCGFSCGLFLGKAAAGQEPGSGGWSGHHACLSRRALGLAPQPIRSKSGSEKVLAKKASSGA